MAAVEKYTKTYTTFSGCDITATFNGKVIGELQAITYSVSREKAPVYTMGSAEPRSFSRGKRGIGGTMVFTVFNRDSLIEEFKPLLNGKEDNIGIQKFKANAPREMELGQDYLSIDAWDAAMNEYAGRPGNEAPSTNKGVSDLLVKTEPVYADEILPFDITITFANEYGQKAVLVIFGVEILNEGSGFSIDSVVTEKAYSFVARRLDYMKALGEDEDAQFSATF